MLACVPLWCAVATSLFSRRDIGKVRMGCGVRNCPTRHHRMFVLGKQYVTLPKPRIRSECSSSSGTAGGSSSHLTSPLHWGSPLVVSAATCLALPLCSPEQRTLTFISFGSSFGSSISLLSKRVVVSSLSHHTCLPKKLNRTRWYSFSTRSKMFHHQIGPQLQRGCPLQEGKPSRHLKLSVSSACGCVRC